MEAITIISLYNDYVQILSFAHCHHVDLQPTQVSVLRERKIVYAAAGASHSIFIDSTGAAYTCGKGLGLLGLGDKSIKTVPTRVTSLEVSKLWFLKNVPALWHFLFFFLQGIKVIRAAAGVSKSIFISSDGFGYWCGEGMGELKNVMLHHKRPGTHPFIIIDFCFFLYTPPAHSYVANGDEVTWTAWLRIHWYFPHNSVDEVREVDEPG